VHTINASNWNRSFLRFLPEIISTENLEKSSVPLNSIMGVYEMSLCSVSVNRNKTKLLSKPKGYEDAYSVQSQTTKPNDLNFTKNLDKQQTNTGYHTPPPPPQSNYANPLLNPSMNLNANSLPPQYAYIASMVGGPGSHTPTQILHANNGGANNGVSNNGMPDNRSTLQNANMKQPNNKNTFQNSSWS
jgi:hypothetical protein